MKVKWVFLKRTKLFNKNKWARALKNKKIMGLSSGFEANSIGGFGAGVGGFPTAFAGGYGGGNWGNNGLGGLGAIGLVGISDLFNRDRDGRHGCDNDDNCAREAAILSAISNSKDATVAEGRGVLAAIANAKDTTVAEGRALGAAICATDAAIKDGNYAAAIQAERNTAQLSAQAQLFAIQADRRADDIIANNNATSAAILAKLNQAELDSLRDQLHEQRNFGRTRDLEIKIENNNTAIAAQFQQQTQNQLVRDLDDHRRRYENREIEINNINTNTLVSQQLQAQSQRQSIVDLDRDHRWNSRFDALQAASAKANNEIVNIGGLVAASQANTANPTNVNTKQA